MAVKLPLTPFKDVLEDFRAGRMVIIVDDDGRENEGDLAIATECITPEAVSFMLNEARGLVCVSIDRDVAKRLTLPLQAINNNSAFQTPFTVSIDHKSVVGRGVTASARAHTMREVLGESIRAEDFVSPGHVFPLIANSAGVLGRQGQTEGSYDLARLAGFKSSGVICEILNPDGSMARGDRLIEFATAHGLKITSIEEIARYRIGQEILVQQTAESVLETDYGSFRTAVFEDGVAGKEHLLLSYGDVEHFDRGRGLLVRIHSECLTGDVFGSRRCDCGEQLAAAAEAIVKEGAGMILYLRQEGRGIGLANKLRAYELQDRGHDTVEANVKLGFEPDARDFAVAANIFHTLKVDSIRLLTNNPRKMQTLERLGVAVRERVSLVVAPNEHSAAYIRTKRDKLGHLL